ncbi:hypothetical protein DM02DRAFT_653822 [Periconia macrospinosa]|uniref:Hepatocellular carcinoma-associated antigen 59-domain-containing protein n=1 Tax=Periconia macrospinosa TaxID=97972 RepID=A0A2V1DYA8_9PLEO|nr:hypothetical protein DM02DRAFT_653822 [Periconia macrospinosa]
MTDNAATSEQTLRFKRRKTTHARRVVHQNDTPIPPPSTSDAPPNTAADPFDRTITPPRGALQDVEDDGEGAPNLKEILRNRKRPRDRLKEVARKMDMTRSQALVPVEAPKQDVYGNRFVAQTGQIVDVDDQQMAEYVEARLAEKNLRLHGWPIPKHLEAAVASLAPDSIEKPAAVVASAPSANDHPGVSDEHNHRLAAGKGKLQEVELSSSGAAVRQDKTPALESTNKVRLGKDGKPRRHPKRRNSEDLRRDQIVEAVLREAKLDYFEEDQATNAPAPSGGDNDEAMAEKFRQDFLESLESRHKRRPAAPSKGAKGADSAKKVSRGPKLGGSRSARAAMHMKRMEEAGKSKR